MSEKSLDVGPGKDARHVVGADGKVLRVPDGWELLPPGDAGLTRRVKAAGPSWTVKEKKGRRTFSKGVWAPAVNIADAKSTLDKERSTDAYAKRRQSDAARRDKKQTEYVEDFFGAVVQFLKFRPAIKGWRKHSPRRSPITQHRWVAGRWRGPSEFRSSDVPSPP